MSSFIVSSRSFSLGLLLAGSCLVSLLPSRSARAQAVVPPIVAGGAGGVYIDTDGTVRYREADAKQLDEARAKARNGPQASKGEKLCYISLPKLFAEVKSLRDAGKEIPQDLRYLGGMTQLRYIFVYPENKDLIIAGPSEAIEAASTIEPFGKRTGRPVLQLDDLVVAIRTAAKRSRAGGGGAFGCSIDPAADSLEKSGAVMREFANSSRADRMDAMARALGPQKVTVFGTADDSRFAFVCVAADYKLKRISLGVEAAPVGGVGNSIDNSRAAANRVWFELDYDPMLVSEDGNAFEVRGQRLQMKAGAQSFDPKGVTKGAENFARQFTQKVPALCNAVPIFADLQNIADLSVLATLIRADRLDQRAGWDMKAIEDPKAWPVATVPVSRTAETLVAYTNGSICAGGVNFNAAAIVGPAARAVDARQALAAPRQATAKLRPSGAAGAILREPGA